MRAYGIWGEKRHNSNKKSMRRSEQDFSPATGHFVVVVIDAPVATPFGLYSLVVLDRASGKVLGKQPLLCDTVPLDRLVSIEKPTSDVAVELPWEAIETYVWRDAEDVDEEEHVSKRLKTLKNPREIFDALKQGVCNPCNPCNLFILAISCIVALVPKSLPMNGNGRTTAAMRAWTCLNMTCTRWFLAMDCFPGYL